MIGHRVRIVYADAQYSTTGTLHKLDAAGALIWREGTLPEQQGTIFVPMHRIKEILDLGRAS